MKKLDNEDFAQSPVSQTIFQNRNLFQLGKNLPNAESIEYSGKAVVALVADPEVDLRIFFRIRQKCVVNRETAKDLW